jgi:hypothetical protein
MGSGSSPPAPAAGGPPPARSSRRWLAPVAAVIVVVVVLIAALFVTGVLHLGSSSSAPAYETFSQAEGVASANSGSVAGAPWFAALGAGVAAPTSILEPVTNLTSLLTSVGCTLVFPHGEPANLDIPSTPTNAATGAAAYWTFGFKNVSNALLIETVSLGVASSLLIANGTACENFVAFLATFPSNVLDSPQIVAAANGAGGSAFLAKYPNATRGWGAVGGIQLGTLASTSPIWEVSYTSCSFPAYSGETGALFNATIAGLTGVVSNSSTSTGACGVTVPTTLLAPLHGVAPALAPRKAI